MNGTNESFLLNEVPLFARRRPNKIVRSFVRSFVPRRRRRLFFSRALSLSLSLSARACVLERFSRLSLFFPLSPYNLSSCNTLNITLPPPPPFPILTFFFSFFCLFLSLIESTRRRGVEKTHRSQSVCVLYYTPFLSAKRRPFLFEDSKIYIYICTRCIIR